MDIYENEELLEWLCYRKRDILGCEKNGQEWYGTKTGMSSYKNTRDIPELTVIAKILEALQTRKFAEWFKDEGNFGKWQSMDDGAPSDLEIIKEIVHIFKI